MPLDVEGRDLASVGYRIRLIDIPDNCPRCHRSIHPPHLITTVLDSGDSCQSIFRCTSQKCEEIFIATYSKIGTSGGLPNFRLASLSPIKHRQTVFSDPISELSPSFVDIYNQAVVAESQGLNQLVGIGIRKALEFLIKDFACQENPGSEIKIREQLLGATISQFVSDSNIKECAKRAAWLGNDETHYTRKWSEKDVEDLKVLTKLTVNWIESSILTKKYLQEMSDGKA